MTTSVKVRMYNTGCGDCYLVTFDTDGQLARRVPQSMSTRASKGPRRADAAARQIVEDLGAKRRLDVVVATHRHEDHVSGFKLDDLWAEVEVGEVWMPWTERPEDPQAVGLRQRQTAAAEALRGLIERLPAADPRAEAAAGIMLNSLTNEPAMKTLRKGFAGKAQRRYLALDSDPPTIAAAPDVKVYVLGPSRDTKVIADLEPPASERWLAASKGDGSAQLQPFAEDWSISWQDFLKASELEPLRLDDALLEAIKGATEDDLVEAAALLEGCENGTSLALAFEVADRVLLFPGDAQWGTWKAILANPTHVDLLRRTSFYKVSHHGSYNATPRTFVADILPPTARAAISVAPVDNKRWHSIPHPDLVAAITAKGVEVVRSDAPPSTSSANVDVRGDISIEFDLTPDLAAADSTSGVMCP